MSVITRPRLIRVTSSCGAEADSRSELTRADLPPDKTVMDDSAMRSIGWQACRPFIGIGSRPRLDFSRQNLDLCRQSGGNRRLCTLSLALSRSEPSQQCSICRPDRMGLYLGALESTLPTKNEPAFTRSPAIASPIQHLIRSERLRGWPFFDVVSGTPEWFPHCGAKELMAGLTGYIDRLG